MTVRVRTPHLDVETRISGPDAGDVVLLLHGWPDDATTYDAVAARLNDAGFRAVKPMLRGFGTTRFMSERR